MGYRYKNYCLDTVTEMHSVVASDCQTVTLDGTAIVKCTPTSTDITVSIIDISTGTTVTRAYVPEQIICDTAPALADVAEIAWLVIGVWVTAWAFKKIADTIRGRT